MDIKTCADCGRECRPDGISAGYATDRDGRVYCYDCAARRELGDLKRDGKGVAYLGRVNGRLMVTTWAGKPLSAGVAYLQNEWCSNFGDRRAVYHFRVEGDPYWWSFQGQGEGLYGRVRRLKQRLEGAQSVSNSD